MDDDVQAGHHFLQFTYEKKEGQPAAHAGSLTDSHLQQLCSHLKDADDVRRVITAVASKAAATFQPGTQPYVVVDKQPYLSVSQIPVTA